MPKISVIIPCFNHGKYINEAVESVLGQTYQDFEIIIINDGSTEELTNRLLFQYSKPKTTVLTIRHQGLATARNIGIEKSKGEYILPLDADDKIGSKYAEEAVKMLDLNKHIGIVYCEADRFNVKPERWELKEYDLQEELVENQIFCSAFFRRRDWEMVGGYNPKMIYGYEDWDFWLSLIEMGRKVYKLPDVHFFNRVREDSMVKKIDAEKQRFLFKQLYLNHLPLYSKEFPDPISLCRENRQLKNSLEAIGASKDYLLGRTILKPLRIIKKVVLK
jgi:glycosyltransferase involved in cell wall biosynthesis